MELRDYLTIFNKSKWFIAIGTVLVLVVTVLVISISKTTYDSTMTVTVEQPTLVSQKAVNYYTYDNYYAIQASGLFANTMAGLLQSPSIVQAIYDRAHVTQPVVRNVAQLGKIFTVRATPPSSFTVTLTSSNDVESRDLLNAASAELAARATELSQQNSASAYSLISTTPVSAQVKPFWALDIVIAIIVGLFVTSLMALLGWYAKEHK